jgi:hypothetical protein
MLFAVVLPVLLIMDCVGGGQNDFVPEEKGIMLCNPPVGVDEIDLDTGKDRDVFEGDANDADEYSIGWRRDGIWRISHDNFDSIEAVSPYSGIVERYDMSESLGKAEWSFEEIIGSISGDRVLAEVSINRERHFYLIDTFSKKAEEFGKFPSRRLPPKFVISPYGDFVTVLAGPAVWLFDCRRKQFSNLTEHLQFPPEARTIDFDNACVCPANGVILFPESPQYMIENGHKISKSGLWAYDPRTEKAHKITLEKYESVNLPCGYPVAPDGKRALLDSGQCFIYDSSTQIAAPVPKVDNMWFYACWSPSGRYISYYKARQYRWADVFAHDVYVADVLTGDNAMVHDSIKNGDRGDRLITWLAPLVSKREANLNYMKWLLSLLERGVETDKVVKRLREITGQDIGPQFKDWQQWLSENEQFLAWSEENQKFTLLTEAKIAKITADAWATIPETKRAAWSTLKEDERAALRAEAEKNLTAQRDLEKAAWKAGVDKEVWVLIPEEKQKTWAALRPEERIALVAEAKRRILERQVNG